MPEVLNRAFRFSCWIPAFSGIDMSYWLTREHENITSPLSPPLKGGDYKVPLRKRGLILSPRPLGERVRVRGIFGSMTLA